MPAAVNQTDIKIEISWAKLKIKTCRYLLLKLNRIPKPTRLILSLALLSWALTLHSVLTKTSKLLMLDLINLIKGSAHKFGKKL